MLALGRKDYLHAGPYKAAQRAAIIYSLLGTWKLHGIDARAWPEDVLERMSTYTTATGDLLPHRWTKRESAATLQTQLPPVCASA